MLVYCLSCITPLDMVWHVWKRVCADHLLLASPRLFDIILFFVSCGAEWLEENRTEFTDSLWTRPWVSWLVIYRLCLECDGHCDSHTRLMSYGDSLRWSSEHDWSKKLRFSVIIHIQVFYGHCGKFIQYKFLLRFSKDADRFTAVVIHPLTTNMRMTKGRGCSVLNVSWV